jgi:hypothetical protein
MGKESITAGHLRNGDESSGRMSRLSHFGTLPVNGEVWVHDLPGLQSRQIEGAKMHSGSHIIVWDCFSAAGVGTLGRCAGTMNGDAYHPF